MTKPLCQSMSESEDINTREDTNILFVSKKTVIYSPYQ